jgi:hypothetical protein
VLTTVPAALFIVLGTLLLGTNSDCPSTETARKAIDQYFVEINNHFSEHPKRAGQKIGS